MRARLAFLALSCVSYGIVQACGGSVGTGADASTDGTVGNDAPISNDASNDVTQPMDTGTTNDTGTPSDASDAGVDTGNPPITSWHCGTAVVTDCSLCIGYTQGCAYCADNDASVLLGTCVEQGTGCGNGIPMGYNLCACTHDAGAATCPEPYQVCLPITVMNSVCDTCGAVTTTNGLTCENGGQCDAVDGGCL